MSQIKKYDPEVYTEVLILRGLNRDYGEISTAVGIPKDHVGEIVREMEDASRAEDPIKVFAEYLTRGAIAAHMTDIVEEEFTQT